MPAFPAAADPPVRPVRTARRDGAGASTRSATSCRSPTRSTASRAPLARAAWLRVRARRRRRRRHDRPRPGGRGGDAAAADTLTAVYRGIPPVRSSAVRVRATHHPSSSSAQARSAGSGAPRRMAEDPAVLDEAGQHAQFVGRVVDAVALSPRGSRPRSHRGKHRSARRRGRGTRRTRRLAVRRGQIPVDRDDLVRRQAEVCRRAGRRGGASAARRRAAPRPAARDRGPRRGPLRRRRPAPPRRTRPTPLRAASAADRWRRARLATPARSRQPGRPARSGRRGPVAGELPRASPRRPRGSAGSRRATTGARRPGSSARPSRMTIHQASPSRSTDSIPGSSSAGMRAKAPDFPQQRRAGAVAGDPAEPVGRGGRPAS